MPVKLEFRGEKIRDLAQRSLKTHLVMALRELTVSQFCEEVVKSMGLGRLRKSESISIVFRGWGQSAPIEFKGYTLIDKVYT